MVQVLNEFTHGTQQEVSKTKFKEVFSDFIVGVADGLKRNPVVILRIDGADLLTFIKSPSFEPEMLSIFSEIDHPDGSLREFLTKALRKLRVEQGMPPTSDIWVMSNVIEPAIQSCGGVPHQPVSQEVFLAEFKRVAERLACHLREEPVIVAHSESTYDGSGIKRLLSNKFEFDKTMESVISGFPKDRNGRISMAYYRVALDTIGPSASLPPVGAVDQIDRITTDALKMLDADKDKMVEKDEFKKVVAEILGSIMLQLEGNPISVSTNSVVHESDSSSSKLFQASST
ncbi:calmodulin-related [Lithospermum erythrorhizon]|uniref:Calmodulin-related n=1 Tax=Lithospermum erythrorhizon TaxID=34254 RepID=A0AAV3RP20_LITER